MNPDPLSTVPLPAPRPPRRGLTLIEAMCTCAIAATLLGLSSGGMHDFVLAQRLKAVSGQLDASIQLARSNAVLHNQTLRLTIQPLAGGSCTLVHTGDANACQCGESGAATCQDGERVLHLERHDASTGVRHLSTGTSLAFSGLRGTVTPTATLKVADRRGRAIHQVVNVMGRTRACSPAGGVTGYPTC